ncbi:MarR family winged helix-turn-helix transcriptional regulator [uncultured Jatrophihabitans sp.]|uniref:MarR family winged helix-turn-helix transcriptional regulator n=1 Tax=uncultured Jatrophihabitans sp. TaxID=1610747 RepID=UPI0035CB6A79
MSTATRVSADAVRAGQDLVSAIGRIRRRLREVATDDHLTPSQTSVLVLLAKNGAASASALAAVENVRPQSMAAILAALDDKGLIQRHADPHDGRRQLVTLTRTGAATFRGTRSARHAWLATRIQDELTADEIRTLIDAAALVERLARQ